MRHDDLVYISHMLDSSYKARDKIEGKTREDYDEDENLRLALGYLVQIIGEAASQVSRPFRLAHPEIPWKGVIGTRHHVVHDYLDVDYDIIWNAVTLHLPPLILSLEKISKPAP